jgi:hypothetical protein
VLISHRKRLIVLALWKTASTTIQARLGTYCESPYDTFYHFNTTLHRFVHQHMVYADLCRPAGVPAGILHCGVCPKPI